MDAMQAAQQAFSDAMEREPFPMECAVTGDWPVKQAIDAYVAATPPDLDKQEAVNLLLKWCGLFFGRNGDGTHMTNEVYTQAHTKLFTETSDWLRAKGYR